MRIETKGGVEWLATLNNYYNSKDLLFRNSEESITLLLVKPNNNILVGRYNKITRIGYVFIL